MAAISMPTGAGFLPFSSALGSSRPHDDFSADIGVGYRYNNWLRFEGTYEYRTAAAGKNTNSVLCPTALTPTPVGSPTPTGYVYDQTGADTSVCTGALDLTRRNSTALAAAYLDLGNYWGVTPYVGGGLGLNADMISGNVGYTVNSTGSPYSADLTAVERHRSASVAEPNGRTYHPAQHRLHQPELEPFDQRDPLHAWPGR